ncbi:MAG: alpha-D-ribose 1-methylphosphonate 5-triphosphate synthase subunit PhnI [Clostridia bacterium]|jgi:alpha-D-ribose 1-methylphosphonate 5-triphosphate synthase subunit PhnI|nr:alpha-D-ribose 1-methylphosphonate 5-triphosphate synthase subunit PhnI [Clostridia bacterium]
MGYVAVKGGLEAIENSEKLLDFFRLKGGSSPVQVRQIQEQFRLAVDKVVGEGSLYAPYHAALALKQSEGDTIEASFILRSFASTVPRTHYSLPVKTTQMRIIRRISAAFKDIPGGQYLGPSRDYTQRLLNFELDSENKLHIKKFLKECELEYKKLADEEIGIFPKVVDLLRKEGLVIDGKEQVFDEPFDITREAVTYPLKRSGRLQAMARGETGGMLMIAYTSMRGYGDIHPTLGELRVGYVPVFINKNGEEIYTGEVLVTEAEVIARFVSEDKTDKPRFTIGYGFCFGHNELKAISMAILDRTMQAEKPKVPAEDQEFVLFHIDGIESSGFGAHWKLPHYITFQSDLDRIRATRKKRGGDE